MHTFRYVCMKSTVCHGIFQNLPGRHLTGAMSQGDWAHSNPYLSFSAQWAEFPPSITQSGEEKENIKILDLRIFS